MLCRQTTEHKVKFEQQTALQIAQAPAARAEVEVTDGAEEGGSTVKNALNSRILSPKSTKPAPAAGAATQRMAGAKLANKQKLPKKLFCTYTPPQNKTSKRYSAWVGIR
jgi:hypothetical protein